ncbi:LisH domain and HEAT repeat KIAA1468-like protein [Heracleum sosnowskyi]|uniref:LisH domain and HEAT repeat KIAA1468-like protein n=1 Tax=Heracleum sosnowskyi TaxID=360622 RepID=A0AAD8HH38_9APIA|nr:LisH domain and HEAT repeat KIAA1468-like protein [Heracleum sosnowskyi]
MQLMTILSKPIQVLIDLYNTNRALISSLLPQKEDNLRSRITKLLLTVSELFGDEYITKIMLPVFLIAVGDKADFTYIPNRIQSRIKGIRPKSSVAERLATMCVLPLLLAGVLGSPSKHENLTEYLRSLLVQNVVQENQPVRRNAEIVNAVRFLCTFEGHHNMVFNILWEMVVSSNMNMKVRAANLLKSIVAYIDL